MKFVSGNDPEVRIVKEGGKTYLEMMADPELLKLPTIIYSSKQLGMPRITEAPFENPDGTPIVFDTDYLDQPRNKRPVAGPLENLKEGFNRVLVWEQ